MEPINKEVDQSQRGGERESKNNRIKPEKNHRQSSRNDDALASSLISCIHCRRLFAATALGHHRKSIATEPFPFSNLSLSPILFSHFSLCYFRVFCFYVLVSLLWNHHSLTGKTKESL
ncbi:hypothetical protein VNO78_06661 [Psophocarpus tetragonolobus]|uniref:Uncharacterized protein n=1 Tax=Psophocarpus tetragonolobus TaxID=3891 RepID=A0AAN9XSD2_PSOTE